MAWTFGNIRRHSVGDRKSVEADVTAQTDGSSTFSPQSVGLHRVEVVQLAGGTASTNVSVLVQTTTAGATHTLVVNVEGTDTFEPVTDGTYRIRFIGW